MLQESILNSSSGMQRNGINPKIQFWNSKRWNPSQILEFQGMQSTPKSSSGIQRNGINPEFQFWNSKGWNAPQIPILEFQRMESIPNSNSGTQTDGIHPKFQFWNSKGWNQSQIPTKSHFKATAALLWGQGWPVTIPSWTLAAPRKRSWSIPRHPPGQRTTPSTYREH